MIAWHIPWDPIPDSVLIIGVVVAGLAYAYGQFKRGSIGGAKESIDIANSEIELLKESRDRLAGEFQQTKEKCTLDIARLEGQVAQLVNGNSELRKLIMLDSVFYWPLATDNLRKSMSRNAYPAALSRVIMALSKWPGVGEKTAARLAIYLLRAPKSEVLELAQALTELKDKIRLCRRCFAFADQELCPICADLARLRGQILVVADPGDLLALCNSNDPLWATGRIEEALARTRKAIQLSPFAPWEVLRSNEARGLMFLRRFDEARAAVRPMADNFRYWHGPEVELAAGEFAAAESIATATQSDPSYLCRGRPLA